MMTLGWRVDILLKQNSEGILMALSAKNQLLLVVVINKYGEKSICQINSYISGARVCANLLKQ